MNINVDLDSRVLTIADSSPVRGGVQSGIVQFVRRGVPQRLQAGTEMLLGIKSWENPADVLLASTTLTRPPADGSPYTFSLSLNTSELLAKFTAGITAYDTSIEVKWETSPGSGEYFKTRRKQYRVEADTIRDSDAVPAIPALYRGDFYVSNGTGLHVNVAAGHMAGAVIAAQSAVSVADNATNYVEVDSSGVASSNTTGFTNGSAPLAVVTTVSGAITANSDHRQWVDLKGGGGGSGSTALPTWIANGDGDATFFFPESGAAISGTTDLYINDVAASGGEGWNGYFLTRIGTAPYTLNLTDSAGHVSTFNVSAIEDIGGGYVHLTVAFTGGYEGDWSGAYQFSLASAAPGLTTDEKMALTGSPNALNSENTVASQQDITTAINALATVASSGAYGDLSGTPVIGTDVLAPAGDGTLLSGVIHPNGDATTVSLGDGTFKSLGDFVLATALGDNVSTAAAFDLNTANGLVALDGAGNLNVGGAAFVGEGSYLSFPALTDGLLVKPAGSHLVSAVPGTDYVVPLAAAHSIGSGLSGTITPDMADGPTQYFDVTGNVTLAAPTGTAIEGVSEMWVAIRYQSESGDTLDLSGIQPDLLSAISFPLPMDVWRNYLLHLRFHGGAWCLVAFTEHVEFVD